MAAASPRPSPPPPPGPDRARSTYRKWIILGAIAIVPLLLVALLRLFVVLPVRLGGSGMEPMAGPGSYVLVFRLAYPDPENVSRGDVVGFFPPETDLDGDPLPQRTWIWRVLGLPGDRVVMEGAHLQVNGERPARRVLDRRDGRYVTYEETLGGRRWRAIYDEYLVPGLGLVDVTVPEGRFFLVGDNRCDALDSRFIGTIPFGKIRGRVVYP